VNYDTAETVWVAGRYTGEGPALTQYNLEGEEVDTLYYHTHAVEKIAPNTLLIFDNDYWNLTRPDPETDGLSGYIEVVYDETAMTLTETWSWYGPPEYYEESQGDAARLPNGNTLGAFNQVPRPIMTEVNQEGEIVWEWILELTNYSGHTWGWGVSANGIMRFLEGPGIEVVEDATPTVLDLNVWEVTQFRWITNGTISVFEDGALLTEHDFEFLPHWQVTELSIPVTGLAAGQHNLTVQIENEDGASTTIIVSIDVPTDLLIYGVIGVGAVVVLVVIVYFYKTKRA
jgi:hypothetical protein